MYNLEKSNEMRCQNKMKVFLSQKISSFFWHGAIFLSSLILFQNKTPLKPLWQKDIHQWDVIKFITFSCYFVEVHSNDWDCYVWKSCVPDCAAIRLLFELLMYIHSHTFIHISVYVYTHKTHFGWTCMKIRAQSSWLCFFRIVIYLIIVETNSFCIWQKSIYSLYGKCYRNQQMTEK